MPSRSGKSQILLAYHAYHVYHYHLAVNPSPESPRHGRASISVRLGDLGLISGWLDAEDKIFMPISLSFQMPIRIWSYFEKQKDNRRKIYSKLLAHSEQIHSGRDIYTIIFFCWFDKIYVKIMLIWLRFLTAGWRLSFWEMDIFGRLILFYCAPARICITSLLDMAIN